MPITDLALVDTTPGADHIFSPPANMVGGEREYRRWLFKQFEASQLIKQLMAILGRYLTNSSLGLRPSLVGPYGDCLKAACIKFYTGS